MKHVFYIFIIIICATIFGSCRSGKSVQKITGFERVQHSTEASTSKQEETIETSADLREDSKEAIQEFTRTTEIDTLGIVRRIQEQWRGTVTSRLVVRSDTGRTVSWIDRVKNSQTRDSIAERTNEQSEIITDSRPVQGVEWSFVMIGTGILLFLASLFLKRRI